MHSSSCSWRRGRKPEPVPRPDPVRARWSNSSSVTPRGRNIRHRTAARLKNQIPARTGNPDHLAKSLALSANVVGALAWRQNKRRKMRSGRHRSVRQSMGANLPTGSWGLGASPASPCSVLEIHRCPRPVCGMDQAARGELAPPSESISPSEDLEDMGGPKTRG